jgi:hypothetical protein
MAGSPPPGQQGYPQGGYPPPGQQGLDPEAPYGRHPRTGVPYSDKQKIVIGMLQLLPIIVGIGGIGRLVMGDTGTGIAQLLLSCVLIGSIWSIIDGIIILVSDDITDPTGRPLRPN